MMLGDGNEPKPEETGEDDDSGGSEAETID
jgi:hypothetical protein